jgi:hypothetical protein
MRARTLAAVLVLLSWSRADACKCAVEPTAIEALGRSDAVFVGTVVDQRSDLFLDGVYSGPTITYDVAVRRAWKGVSAERLSLRRVGPCEPSFRVGQTYLIYAGWWRGNLVPQGCLPTKHVDDATADLSQLGAPVNVFTGDIHPVATSLPASRWLRAHIVAGLGLYAYHYAQSRCESPAWSLILFPAVAVPFAIAATIAFVRRRWRTGLRRLAGGMAVLAMGVLWTGHEFLSRDWSEAFLRW